MKMMTIDNIKSNADHHFKPGDMILGTGCKSLIDLWVHKLPNGKLVGYTESRSIPMIEKPKERQSQTMIPVIQYSKSDEFTEGMFFGVISMLLLKQVN